MLIQYKKQTGYHRIPRVAPSYLTVAFWAPLSIKILIFLNTSFQEDTKSLLAGIILFPNSHDLLEKIMNKRYCKHDTTKQGE